MSLGGDDSGAAQLAMLDALKYCPCGGCGPLIGRAAAKQEELRRSWPGAPGATYWYGSTTLAAAGAVEGRAKHVALPPHAIMLGPPPRPSSSPPRPPGRWRLTPDDVEGRGERGGKSSALAASPVATARSLGPASYTLGGDGDDAPP